MDYDPQKDGEASYLAAIAAKKARGDASPIKREVVIGDCAGMRVEFVGVEKTVSIYAILPAGAGSPVYVGSTSQLVRNRIRGHILDAKAGSSLPIHVWIRLQSGFRVEVLEVCAGDDATRELRERHWVSQFDGLLNVTDGGAGASGTVWPAARRARVAEAMRTGGTFDCQQCGVEFWRKRREIEKGHNKFCSRGCYQQSIRGKTRPIPEHVRLRGVEAAAKRRKELTHCYAGHPLSGENLRVNKSGSRVCRTCERAHKRPNLAGGAHV